MKMEDIKPFRELSPVVDIKPFQSQTQTPSRSVSAIPARGRVSYRGTLDKRYPSPPPPTDPLGPAAQYPFLPEDGEQYSCRIGGPRIFDLLNTLPLDEFGVMSWAIVDREEELFEMEDLRDEDKVMMALWNRWIMIKR